jgi:hypothetical protein
MTSSARAQRLVDEFEDRSAQLGGFSIRHGIAAVLYELVGQVVPEERAPHSVDPPESANTIAIYAMHAERTRLRGELVEIMDALTAPTLVDRALAGDAAAAKQFLHEAGFTDQQGQWLPQYQPVAEDDVDLYLEQ